MGLIRLASLNFVLSTFVVHAAMAERRLQFRLTALVEVPAAVLGSTTAVLCAWQGLAATSLVIGTLTATTAMTIGYWLTGDWMPRLRFCHDSAISMMRYGRGLLGFNTVNYWGRNVDNMLLGAVAGTAALGLYTRAYMLMLIPVQLVTIVIGRVLFPTLARLRDDMERLRQAYKRTVLAVVLVTLPITLGMATTSKALITTLYGHKWIGASSLLTLLALSGPPQILLGTLGSLYKALGHTDLLFKKGLLSATICICAIAVGLPFGAPGVAAAFLVQAYVTGWIIFRSSLPLIDGSTREFGRLLRRPIIAGAVMSGCVVVTGEALTGMAPPVVLAAQVGVGVLTYIVLVVVLAESGGAGLRGRLKSVRAALA